MLRFMLLLVLFCSSVLGHTNKPAYLKISAIGKNKYEIKWKVPRINKQTLSVTPVFPSLCQEKIDYIHKNENMHFTSSVLKCTTSLIGESIAIKNIEKDMISVIFHFSENNTSFFTALTPSDSSLHIENTTKTSQNTHKYVFLGIKHILIGYDHLLFVLGLLLLIRKIKILAQTITAFTISHSITLGASAFGFVSMPVVFIEILIALSIIILAAEVLYMQKGKFGLSSKYPWAVALFFGLIHGFGFANVLSELSLPKNHLLEALLFFNIGIELGQILFIGVLIVLYYVCIFCIREAYVLQGKTLIAYGIGTMAAYWFAERLFSFFGY